MRKMEEQIADGLCACVYTQLSDVEEEVNVPGYPQRIAAKLRYYRHTRFLRCKLQIEEIMMYALPGRSRR